MDLLVGLSRPSSSAAALCGYKSSNTGRSDAASPAKKPATSPPARFARTQTEFRAILLSAGRSSLSRTSSSGDPAASPWEIDSSKWKSSLCSMSSDAPVSMNSAKSSTHFARWYSEASRMAGAGLSPGANDSK